VIYNLINPSDTITFLAPSKKIATLLCIALADGKYAANAYSEDDKRLEAEDAPLLMFADEAAICGALQEPPESLDSVLERHEAELITALESMAYVNVGDRPLYDAKLASLADAAERKAFIEEWDERKRTSLNAIVKAAHRMAAAMRKPGSKERAEAP
jgi:hypothetical protein